MSAITTKVDICNLANGSLGNRNTLNNIDTPKTDKEIVYSLWYDIIRQLTLKTMMPNFALYRLVVSAVTVPPGYTDSYSFAYEYPNRCLKLLGIGSIDCNDSNRPTIEGGIIFTNTEYPDGMPIRIIDDVDDVTRMTPEFIITFASELGKRTALSTTQDAGKKAGAAKDAMTDGINASALNAQENKPIRRSTSRFRQARYATPLDNPEKR